MGEFVDVRVDGRDQAIDFFRVIAGDQLPFALSKACNDTAFLIRDADMAKMREVFDRPKEQTVRNIRVSKGNKKYPGATIFFDQIYEGDEYMVAQVDGGKRSMKRSETILGHYFVPGAGAQIDQYGNMKASQITQILSRLGQFKEQGYQMNQTKRTAGRRAGQGNDYFMLSKPTNGLAAGIYQRVDGAERAGRIGRYMLARAIVKSNKQKGQLKELDQRTKALLKRGIIPVMIFVKSPPTYTKRFPFHEVAKQVTDANFNRLMSEAVDFALRTAR